MYTYIHVSVRVGACACVFMLVYFGFYVCVSVSLRVPRNGTSSLLRNRQLKQGHLTEFAGRNAQEVMQDTRVVDKRTYQTSKFQGSSRTRVSEVIGL